MKKNLLKRIAAILLLIFFFTLLALTIFFGIKGNSNAAISLLVFNGFFTVVVYFLLQFTRYLQYGNDNFNENADDDSQNNLNSETSNKNSIR